MENRQKIFHTSAAKPTFAAQKYIAQNMEAYIAFFLILASGIAIGQIKVKGVSLDISAVIFVAMIFGHYGIEMPSFMQHLGLVLFIYSIGIQAGPGFFDSFKKHGVKLMSLAAIVIVCAAVLALGLSYIFDYDESMCAGLFTGALTSTPGLAAAIDATKSSMASIGYGLAYPFGVIGVILFVKLAPAIFRIDIKKEEENHLREVQSEHPRLTHKNYRVSNPNIFGKSIGELDIRTITGCNVSRILHNNTSSTPFPHTILYEGDILKAVGTPEGLEKFRLFIGEESNIPIPLGDRYIVETILVSNKKIVKRSLSNLGLMPAYNATAASIRRSGIDILPCANTRLQLGDKVTIACPESEINKISQLFGNSTKKLNELDLLPVSLGILIGVLFGRLELSIFGLEIQPGITGGVLIAALVLSKIGRTGNIVWNVSGITNQLLRQLGLIFFLASIGCSAGGKLVETISSQGVSLFISGVIITLVPMITAMLAGHYLMKINFLTLLGTLCGSMTSTPALSALESLTPLNTTKVAYATVYPFAMVILIIVTKILTIII